MTLFGWSDGGGGPTPEMLAAAHRNHDGSPRVTLGSPAQFFDEAKRALPDPAVWYGEMYIEGHRGTYTSQARTKQGNRRSEHLRPEQLISTAQRALAGHGTQSITFNAAPMTVGAVTALGAGPAGAEPDVVPTRSGSAFVLENGRIVARFDAYGSLVSFLDRPSGRELIAPGEAASVLQIFRDTPAMFEAWDIDRSYQRSQTELRAPDAVEIVDLSLVVTHIYGKSTIVQRYWLGPDDTELQIGTTVDWHEQEKLLKLTFPLDLRADQAASEVQFGHVLRPTYVNTSWDHARFETVAHRWVHVAELDIGVVVANGSTYGHDITRSVRADGGTTTVVRESLLRGPKYPDPQADQGRHVLRTALGVAAGVLDAASAGYRINLPARTLGDAGTGVAPVVTVSAASVLVEAVKLAEDRSGDLIVRLYEAAGARARTTVRPDFGWTTARTTDLLERDLGRPTWTARETIDLELRPFEIVTLRISPFR